MAEPLLLLAGGGTGGHIFPGIAIAEAWKKNGGQAVFVGTPRGQEKDIVPRHGFELHLIQVGTLKGAGIKARLKTLLSLPLALLQAWKLLRLIRPSCVLGIGGYASGPICLMAWLSGIPMAITDQNVQPGLTNRILGKLASRIFLSFAESSTFFPKRKINVSGNPVRSNISFTNYPPPLPFTLFIFGGSQGAVALNQAVIGALERLKSKWSQIRVFHQSGKTDSETLKKFYSECSFPSVVSHFFDDMQGLYSSAHLVIARAGAGTLTELALSGRPAILVPYPFAADDHQTHNARVFVNAGGAVLIPQQNLTPEILSEELNKLLNQPQILTQMAQAMHTLSKPQAAQTIVQELRYLISDH